MPGNTITDAPKRVTVQNMGASVIVQTDFGCIGENRQSAQNTSKCLEILLSLAKRVPLKRKNTPLTGVFSRFRIVSKLTS